jgi:hypothetical protein
MLEPADFPRADRGANPARGNSDQGFLAQISARPSNFFCRRTAISSPALFQDTAGYKLVLEKITGSRSFGVAAGHLPFPIFFHSFFCRHPAGKKLKKCQCFQGFYARMKWR